MARTSCGWTIRPPSPCTGCWRTAAASIACSGRRHPRHTTPVTFGCINVPVSFYDTVVHPAFTQTSGIVYILPEIKSISQVFFAAAS